MTDNKILSDSPPFPGRPNIEYSDHYVAFLDVLGFSTLVKSMGSENVVPSIRHIYLRASVGIAESF